MDDQEVLKHLLSLEAEAAALADDAQAEADRRISEGEKQNRARYDEAYAKELAVLEDSYNKNLEAVNEDFRRQLEAYKESLNSISLNLDVFYSMTEKLLSPGAQSGRDQKDAGITR